MRLSAAHLMMAILPYPVCTADLPSGDWLVDPASYKAEIRQIGEDLVMSNGLVRRTIRLAPAAATIDYRNLVTGEQVLRATGPEAVVAIDGTTFPIGGLTGQPVQNYLKQEWIATLRPLAGAYQFVDWKEAPLAARMAWKKRPEWLARDCPWPAPGRQVTLRFAPPAAPPAAATGPVLFADAFGARRDASWKVRVSGRHPRSSFANEGKHGEIYTPPDTAVFAERPWPVGAVSVLAVVDAGDDTRANAWGPGLALVAADRTLAFVIRPNQGCYDINGTPQAARFDRAKPVHLRVRLAEGQAHCEASQDGQTFSVVASVPWAGVPAALRIGKVGKAGAGEDYQGEDAPRDPIRCHVASVEMRGAGPAQPPVARTDLPAIDVHYAIYDGIPLIEKWLTVRNTTQRAIRVDRTVVEILRLVESESAVEPNAEWEPASLHVESDYTYCSMNAKGANRFTVRLLPDKDYRTQVNYDCQTPCLLEVAPEFGPAADVPVGGMLTSIRAFELLQDGTDKERRYLARRRMYRTVAPWVQENPVMVHLISDKPDKIRSIIDQAAEVGAEMIILSFGSGMNMENADPAYHAKYREVADYAKSKGIVLGAYSLLASRGAADKADNCGGPGARVRFGAMPCLGSTWGRGYLAQLSSFMEATGFAILEHDGSYPADTCARTSHPGHRGLDDSQWAQWQAITAFYKECRGKGIYLNIPDWYFFNGGSKTGMGYRETNWSLPRAEQEIIERQNIYDGTWDKTPSMGWMFVPLTQYHGGGAAATIEPLDEHRDHYEARLANLFGAGVQACWRGPRIYDTDRTRDLVKRWIGFYKRHRTVLDADLIHLRRPDGRDWDGFVHVDPRGDEKALAFLYNPLPEAIKRTIRVPLHYAGLRGRALMSHEDGTPEAIALDVQSTAEVTVDIPARGRTWLVFAASR